MALQSSREQFIMDLARQYNLTRQMARMLAHLVRAPNVTHEAFHELFASTDDRVLMHRLRKRLKGSKIAVNTMYGIGYYLDEVTRARIKKAIGDLHAAASYLPSAVRDDLPRVPVYQIPQGARSGDAGSGCRGCEAA